MATRSEQFHAEQQRSTSKKSGRSTEAKPAKAAARRGRAKGRKDEKNRVKGDAALNHVEEMRKGSPASRYRKARAKATRTRGGAGG